MVDGLETSYSELVGIPVFIVGIHLLVKDAAQMAYQSEKPVIGLIWLGNKSKFSTGGGEST